MKKKIMAIIMGILLLGANAYAAGDLIVNGKLEVTSTDLDTFKTTLNRTTNTMYSAGNFNLEDTKADATNGWRVLSVVGTHNATNFNGPWNAAFTGTQYTVNLTGSGSALRSEAQFNTIVFNSPNNYTFNEGISGNISGITTGGLDTGTRTSPVLASYKGLANFGNGTATYNITNMTHFYAENFARLGAPAGTQSNVSGMQIDKQTMGVNRMGIWLNGDGAGADIVFGPSKEARIYLSSGRLYAQDSFGNQTILSPHDPETGEWVFYSKNIKTGKVVRVDMEKLVKAVEKLTGEKFMVETLGESE